MSNEKDEAPAAGEERPKRAPPTIDLGASEVSGDARTPRGTNATRTFMKSVGDRLAAFRSGAARALSRLLAPLSGAVAALLVLAAAWAGGLIGPSQAPTSSVSSAQFDSVADNVGNLAARLARVEASTARPAAPAADSALGRRTEAVEKSVAAVRDEVAGLTAQLRSLTSSQSEVRSPPSDGAPAGDPGSLPGPLNERLTRLEEATKSLSTELAKPAAATADDLNVRRLVVANALDAAVHRGEPYAAALAAAKQAAVNSDSLAPLDAFAAKGIPSEATYLRDIVPVLQRIATGDAAKAKRTETSAADGPNAGPGVLDRLQSGLAKLVRIERSDVQPEARDSAPSPAAVRRDSLAAARQDIARLPQASDPQIQAWLTAVDAREAALAASQKFSAEALAAFGKSGQ